jgi:hypothetical protein
MQHLSDSINVSKQRDRLIGCQEPKPRREFDLRSQLRLGTQRDSNVVQICAVASPCVTFSDV